MNSCVDLLSPPAWWCGLKFRNIIDLIERMDVTTCVVVWIEIESEELDVITDVGHHLRGGVD